MSAPTLADCWVPLPLRARHLRPWDMIVSPDGALWAVLESEASPAGRYVRAVCGPDTFSRDLDPDETVTVLVPLSEREALTVARDELAARVIERRIGDTPSVTDP